MIFLPDTLVSGSPFTGGDLTLTNPFAYIHSEKDILKVVTALIANTKGEGKAGDDFWVKAETLLYTALIGYIHYPEGISSANTGI